MINVNEVCVIPGQIGDGKRVLRFVPIATRPRYFLIRVDSAFGDDDDACDAIERHVSENTEEREDDWDGEPDWPAVDWSCGWVTEDASKEEEEACFQAT